MLGLVTIMLKTGIFKRISFMIGLVLLTLGSMGCRELIAGSPTPTPFRGVVYITVTPAPHQAQVVARVNQGIPAPAAMRVAAPQSNPPGQPDSSAALIPPQPESAQPAAPQLEQSVQPTSTPPNPVNPPTNQPTPVPISQPDQGIPPDQGTRVGFAPAALTFSSCGSNQSTIITAYQISNLQGFAFKVRFDPNIVRVADADPALAGVQIGLGDSFRSQTHFIAQNSVDLNSGLIDFAAVMLGGQGISGDAALAQIEWIPVQAGSTAMTLEQVELSTGSGVPIQAQANPGSASVRQNCGG